MAPSVWVGNGIVSRSAHVQIIAVPKTLWIHTFKESSEVVVSYVIMYHITRRMFITIAVGYKAICYTGKSGHPSSIYKGYMFHIHLGICTGTIA